MYQGADPAAGWIMNDPIFGKKPTLGACMPNLRRAIKLGDYVFTISGRVKDLQQYVVGGFQVKEKIDALAAYSRFPENRISKSESGQLLGNIVIDEHGNHHPLDNHAHYERRLENYLIGHNPIVIEKHKEIERARAESLPILSDIFDKRGNRIFDVIGRGYRKMDSTQLDKMLEWLEDVKS